MADRTIPLAGEPARQAETESERAVRLARERILLEQGFADIRAGRSLTGAELDAWLERFVQGLPPASPPGQDGA